MRSHRTLLTTSLSLAVLFAPAIARAQGTLEDYRRAATVNRRVEGLTVRLVPGGVNWIDGSNQFWYRVTVPGGSEFVFVDAAAWTKQPAFDHQRLAAAFSTAAGAQYTAITLPFNSFTYVDNRSALEADATGSRWRCTLTDYTCTRVGEAQTQTQGGGRGGRGGPTFVAGQGGGRAGGRGGFGGPGGPGGGEGAVRVSPDRSVEASVQNYNIAIRPAGSSAWTTLSTDGVEGDAYQLGSVQWSPDSKKLVVFRRKDGGGRLMYRVRSSPTDQVQPRLEQQTYEKPGDVRALNTPVLFDVATRKQTIIDNTLFSNAYQISSPQWRENGAAFTFEYNQRGHQVYRVLEVNAETGVVRALIDEQSPTFIAYRTLQDNLRESGRHYRYDIADGREIIWMSERDGWGQLYLYDGVTGKVKNQITKGEWVVKQVDSVDVAKRQIWFRAGGMNRNQDPYFTHFYRINFDGKGLIALTEGDGMHSIAWSPDRQYYVDTYSRVDMPPVLELRRTNDRRMMPLEAGDMSAALATGWRPPEVFVAKGRDGVTDIWGYIVRPFTFDANRKYPVIENIYAGPQGSHVPKTWGGGQSLVAQAELGFILAQVDGMGTGNRSKAFHDVAWQNLADAGFPDRILWHKAINAKYPWYDISRVGVYGGSAGGQNAAGAVFLHGDFYDAAFASSGCHDNRMDKMWWNEHWMGWPIGPHYEASSNVTHAHKLTGKLFLAVGEQDTNVDPASTMQVVNALVNAGKTFQLLVVPNGGHGATGPQGTRTRNDFFVKSLLGVDPPDWNSGLTIGLGSLDLYEYLGIEEPHYGFFESPEDEASPLVWW